MRRHKTDAQIVADSLALAERKAQEGCTPCVSGLVALASQHGATPDQLAPVVERLVSRGTLLKAGAAGLFTAAGAVALPGLPALAASGPTHTSAPGTFLTGSGRV